MSETSSGRPVSNDAAEIGCSGSVDKVTLGLSVEPVAPSCTALAEIPGMGSLGLATLLWTSISRSDISAATTEIDSIGGQRI
jgi:hypothetical protein